MIWRIALILAGLGLTATSTLAQEPGAQAEPDAAAPPAALKALADTCAAHKFETMVVFEAERRAKKVKICGEAGQSDADWLVTLRDSAAKVAADEDMSQLARDQIIAALKSEIDRLESAAAPLAVAPVAAIKLTEEPVSVPEAAPQYSSVPPLPAPRPRAALAKGDPSPAPVARPRLTVRCAMPRDRFAACARLERETQLLIRADENLGAGVSIRFLRGGDDRAELDLGAMMQGETLREKLPGGVCSGVLRGKVEVQVLRKNQIAETLGPYPLYCGS